VIVSVVESILLLALTPALFRQFEGVGWFSLSAAVAMAGLTYIWYTGKKVGHAIWAGFEAVSLVALGAGAIVFLTTQPPLTALVFVALAYVTAGAFARRDRRAGTLLLVVLIIGFVILFASASKTARDRLDLMLLLVGIYAALGGLAAFLFQVRFQDLRNRQLLAYFGYRTEPDYLVAIDRLQAYLRQAVAAGYSVVHRLVQPLGRAWRRAGSSTGSLVGRIPAGSRRTTTVLALVVLLLVFPIAVRWLEQLTNLSLLITVNVGLLFVVLALGLNVVVGFAGLLDLGYAAFFAIGAYTVGIFTWPNLGLQWSFWVAIWLSTLVAAIFGMIIGAPTLRLRGDYLAIVTLAFGEIVPRAIREMWDIRIRIPFTDIYLIGSELEGFNLTNGPQGMNPVGRPFLFGYEVGVDPIPLGPLVISPPMQWYFLIVLVGSLVLLAAFRLEHSRLGRAWMAIREDETAADSMGVDPIRTKLMAFALGASFSGFAGSIYAAMIQAIFPELFSFLVSIFLLIIVIVSGMGNIWGVLLGGLIISLFDRVGLAQIVPQYVPGGDVLQRWRWVMYAAGLIAVMVLRPEGLFPSAARAAELHEIEPDVDEFMGDD
jgi:branched-chain amino acid transport system permease protein